MYDAAFTKQFNLAQVLGHELTHRLRKSLSDAEFASFLKAVGESEAELVIGFYSLFRNFRFADLLIHSQKFLSQLPKFLKPGNLRLG